MVDINGDECTKSINKKFIDIIFIFTWKIGLSLKFNFSYEYKIQLFIFVDENKNHIHNDYEKLNFKNIIKNHLSNGWTLVMVGS